MRGDTRFTGDDLRASDPKFLPPRYSQYLSAVEALDDLARQRYGKSVLALAVRWVLDQGPAVALWGARHPEQLAPIRDALGWQIDEETRREIDRILHDTVTDPIGPEFMAPPARRRAKARAGETAGPRRTPARSLR